MRKFHYRGCEISKRVKAILLGILIFSFVFWIISDRKRVLSLFEYYLDIFYLRFIRT